MIRLWKGFHSAELPVLIERAWNRDELLILCPPLLRHFEFIDALPEGELELMGDWDPASAQLLQQRKRLKATPNYPARPVLGVFTTGTIGGTPRLVLYSKNNIESSLSGVREFFDTSRIQKIFCYPQPFHTFGLILGYLQSLLFDVELVSLPGKYSRAAHALWLQETTDRLLTLGTPTHFYDLAHFIQSEQKVPRATYASIAGGAKVSVASWRQMRDDLKIESPSIGYGATEASPAIAHLPPGREPYEDGEVGLPLPTLKTTLRPGQGIEFSGPHVCLAIVHKDEVRFPEKVLIRDDLRMRESDGVMLYVGRHELLINRGGIKISIERMEERIREQFGIEVICSTVPDERLGEELGILARHSAGVVVDPEVIYQDLKHEFGQSFDSLRFNWVSEFPVNAAAKVDREACRQLSMSQKKLSYPISVKELQSWLPHRPPAVWIDTVESVTENSGICVVIYRGAAHYASSAGLRLTSMIEWIAQSYGYICICQAMSSPSPVQNGPKKAFLVALRNVEFFNPEFTRKLSEGTRIQIGVRKTHQVGPISLVDGKVTLADGTPLAQAQVRLYSE